MADRFIIKFEPDGAVAEAAGVTPLWLAALSAGVSVEHPCGGAGTCGNCRVRVVEGIQPPSEADRLHLDRANLDAGWRLGCQLVFDRPAVVQLPASIRSVAGKSFGAPLPADRVDPPDSPLSLRLAAGARPPDRGWLGVAIDIGSTSLAAALVGLSNGEIVTCSARLNPQVAMGADVISRIQFARDQPDGLVRLTGAVRDGLAALVDELCREAGRAPHDVIAATVVGNPTMLHTWAGVSPASLGEAPFVGAWTGEIERRAAEVGLPVHPEATVRVLSMIGSHVGADTVAAILATDLDLGCDPTLLIDLGTNTEMVLAAHGALLACSAAAGPAFEGATVGQGMRAAAGAIDAVRIGDDGELQVHTIGGGEAAGICGSGLVDAVAELRRAGLVSPSGLLASADQAPPGLSAALGARLGTVRGQRAIVLAARADGGRTPGVALTAGDIRQVQLVKASIGAGVAILCREAGVDPLALDRILVAGAFGNYLRKASAIRIGLVPPVDATRVQMVGNAAGVGARLALVDRRSVERTRAIASATRTVELAASADYQQLFLDALAFPV